jgi:hypothetical protein
MKILRHPSRLTKLVVALLVFAVVFHFAFRLTSEGRRLARIKAAGIHAESVVAPLLAKDKRFDCVFVSAWYKGGGYFLVHGAVETQPDFEDLKRLILETHPPAPIAWQVVVAETNTTTNGLQR